MACTNAGLLDQNIGLPFGLEMWIHAFDPLKAGDQVLYCEQVMIATVYSDRFCLYI
jgi:hypothetical protein